MVEEKVGGKYNVVGLCGLSNCYVLIVFLIVIFYYKLDR